MIAMQQEVRDPPLTDEQIIDMVISSNDRGHNAGRGRHVPDIGSSHHPRLSQDYMTRENWIAEREVLIQRAQVAEALIKEAQNEAASARNESSSARNEASGFKEMFTQFMAHYNSQTGSSTNLTPFIPRPPVPSQPLPNPSTDHHHSLVDINPDPNLYQSTMNPGGCYRPVIGTDD